MSIQDIQNELSLVQCFKEFLSAKDNFLNAVGMLDGSIQKLEGISNYSEIASEEEIALVVSFKEKINLLR